jgi:hypothetical protein
MKVSCYKFGRGLEFRALTQLHCQTYESNEFFTSAHTRLCVFYSDTQLPERGSKEGCANYRAITQLHIWSRMCRNGLNVRRQNVVLEEQSGFVKDGVVQVQYSHHCRLLVKG